ncbi:hypothetical protein DDI_2725 [Dickeya dianthicola RNS04.9]|nr:hypothetical protein DDI_2725 [Dickeya dianthicola RNS04.9]
MREHIQSRYSTKNLGHHRLKLSADCVSDQIPYGAVICMKKIAITVIYVFTGKVLGFCLPTVFQSPQFLADGSPYGEMSHD